MSATISKRGIAVPALSLNFFLILCSAPLFAQVGNDNRTGVAGVFNGNVTTGCSYDPYTANAMRSVTDLVVAGGVGTYPLAFSRVANSRSPQYASFQFGGAGGWQHSYSWSMADSDEGTSSQFQPGYYLVNFPDGRTIGFAAGSPFDGYFYGGPGIRERFQPMGSNRLAYLILSDGGKIQFYGTLHSYRDADTGQWFYYYTYQAQAIIDPYGLPTTLAYNSDGSLNTIHEPAGRWLQLIYRSSDHAIDHVQASDGRVVQYNYTQITYAYGVIYTALDNVVYPYETTLQSSPTAHYTYQAPNVGNPALNPLLASCDDPMYGGPMTKISYTYATGVNSDNSTVVFGQIQSENSGTTGQPVTSLGFVVSGRAETRADGNFRNFLYGNGQIANSSDFYFHFAAQGYDSTTGFINSATDRNGHTTDIVSDPISGNITQVTFPLTPNDTPPGTPRGRVSSVYGGSAACGDPNNQEPYYLCSSTDEGGHTTTYWRDNNKRVAQINYPDGGYETFSYNPFGEIETHRKTSGGLERFTYDSNNGLKLTYRDPDHDPINQTGNPTARYQYDSLGRLHGVTDARGGYSGDPAYTTTTDYNQRGQVIRLTHPGGSFITYGYDGYGNRTSVTDELNHGTTFDYDDYGRVIKVTDPLTHFTSISYAPWSGLSSYSHTTKSVYRVTSPLLKVTDFDYDANFRRAYVRKGSGSVDDDGGTYFGYDYAGNLTSVRDPRQNTTTFVYDERNRRASVTDALTHPTATEYDAAGRPAKTIRADSSYSRAEYDSMNRVIDTYGFANEHTHYERDVAGNIRQLVDPKPATFLFDYDTMNRKRGITYPVDATGVQPPRSETWHYDPVTGNMDQYTNPAGQIKTLGYDTRNRFIYSSWNAGGGPALGLGYYDNSQLGIIVTYVGGSAETTVVFGYDAANRQTWEEQTVAGFPTRPVETPRDSDGNRSSLNVPGWYALQYDYTQRNQLWHIKDGGGTQWFTYSYDPAGNMIKRQDVYPGGVNDSLNIPSANYDAINRPTMWENTGAGDTWFARSHYQYDNLNREVATWRDEQGGKGEWFGFDPTGQLTGVSYNADGVSSGNPQNASRTVSYTPTADKLNRSSMNDNGDISDYTPNALNQYENVAGGSFSYDGNFNLTGTGGFYATYNSANQATSIYSGEDQGQFVYDGLGRCVKRTVDGETTLITYDGWKPIVEWDGWGNFLAWNIYGFGADEILWRHHLSFGDLRYHSDRRGNIVALLDNNGNGIEKYTYDAFGDPEVTDWSGANERDGSWYGNRFMFKGREYIAELGLYDFRNRFYYPELGRFLQSDPKGFDAGDNNLFRYCGDDPVNKMDPFGLQVIGEYHDPTEEPTTQEILGQKSHEEAVDVGINNLVLLIDTILGLFSPPPVYYVAPRGSDADVPDGQPIPTAVPPPVLPSHTRPPPPKVRFRPQNPNVPGIYAEPGPGEIVIPFEFVPYSVVRVQGDWDFGSGGSAFVIVNGKVVRVY